MYLTMSWVSIVVLAIMGGELGCCDTSIMLKNRASHHDCSVTYHVSAIQTFIEFSHSRLPGGHHHGRSDFRNSNEGYCCG